MTLRLHFLSMIGVLEPAPSAFIVPCLCMFNIAAMHRNMCVFTTYVLAMKEVSIRKVTQDVQCVDTGSMSEVQSFFVTGSLPYLSFNRINSSRSYNSVPYHITSHAMTADNRTASNELT